MHALTLSLASNIPLSQRIFHARLSPCSETFLSCRELSTLARNFPLFALFPLGALEDELPVALKSVLLATLSNLLQVLTYSGC